MAKDQRPHVVARTRGVAEPVAKREVEARPTCKLDKNELLGLVVKSSGADAALPRRSKRHTDLEISVEVSTDPTPAPRPRAKANRVVQTVRRANVAKSEMAPLQVAPTGTDVSMPASAAAPVPAPARAETADPFADMFADTLGADPTPTPTARAATGSGTHAPLESSAQDIPTEIPAPDFDAFGDTAMLANSTVAAMLPLEPPQPSPLAEGSIVAPPVAPPVVPAVAPPVHLHHPMAIDDTAPLQAIMDAAVAPAEPAPVAEPERVKPPVPRIVLTPVRTPRRRFAGWRSPGLLQQIAIGVVLGCVGIGVYLGIAAI